MNKNKIYLLPNHLGECNNNIFPLGVEKLISEIRFFYVENVRNARRFLKQQSPDIEISGINFCEIDKHKKEEIDTSFILDALKQGNMGVLSESGMPCIADPGSKIIVFAHKQNIEVVPCVGPSSIFLALSASGLNGQRFLFRGYLPIQENEKRNTFKEIEKDIFRTGTTHIFIETPYRANALLGSILKYCNDTISLCIAKNVTLQNQNIQTKSIREWKRKPKEIQKEYVVFLLGV